MIIISFFFIKIIFVAQSPFKSLAYINFVILTEEPELPLFEVLKYSQPSTVPLCLPLVLSWRSSPKQISFCFASFLCLSGPTYFIVAVFLFNSTLFPNKFEVSSFGCKFIFGYFRVIRGSYDSTYLSFSYSNLAINSTVFLIFCFIIFFLHCLIYIFKI